MKTNRIKSVNFMFGIPDDIYGGCADIFVTLENDDDFVYFFEVTTPQALASHLDERNQKFLEPFYPCIIVRELTPAIIEEALEVFLIETEDGYWFKFYALIHSLTIDDLNLIRDRKKKENQAD